jgi:hypothetical protein
MLQLPPFRYQTNAAALYAGGAAPAVADLDLNFLTTTTLDPRITFSRTSLATYFDSAGLNYAAHNWAVQSQDFNTTWTKVNSPTVTVDATAAPDSTLTADKLNHTVAGTAASGRVQQALPLAPYQAICSVYAKAGTKSFVALGNNVSGNRYCYFNLSTGAVATRDNVAWISAGIQNAGNGWYRCYAVVPVLGLTSWSIGVAEADNNLNCTSTGDIFLWGAQYEFVLAATTPSTYIPTTTAAVHAARFDFDPVTHAAKGLLIEEARTNVVLQNRDLTAAAWVKTGCTAAKNQIGVDGVANSASSLTATAANATSLQAITLASSARYQSAYVKRLTGSGVVNMTMNGGTTWTPVTVTSSWTRVEIPSATITNPSVGFQIVTSGDAIAVDAVQNENGAYATSAMLTTTASFARAADSAVMTGTNFSNWYNQTAGTFVAEFDLLNATGTRGILSADNNATAESIRLYGSGTDPKVTIIDNSVTQADLDLGTIAANTNYKLGVAYAVNDIAACLNGGTVGLDTAATLPTPTQLRIGAESATIANNLDGHVRRIQFFNTAKSDAELQALTT